VQIAFDTDGTPRYEYPVVPYHDAYYPALALQALRLYLGLALEEVQVRFGVGIQLGAVFVPTDEAMRLLINYYGPAGTFPTYSFVDVMHNRLPETAFRDTIVLIGAAATGLGDTFVRPFHGAPGLSDTPRSLPTLSVVTRFSVVTPRRSLTSVLWQSWVL
jgi:hypothetical protein